MHKKNSVSHLRTVLSDVVSIGYEHLQSLAAELKKLDVTPENYKDKSEHDINKSQMMANILTLINDVIHPAHNLSLELFPDAKPFIDVCIKNQELAVQKKLIAPNCNCYECKTKLKA
jgi:hypothetical protein